jgi:hypothetical protein
MREFSNLSRGFTLITSVLFFALSIATDSSLRDAASLSSALTLYNE